MKRIIFALCIFFALTVCGFAKDLYTCTGADGNSVVTDTPQDEMKHCVVLKDTSRSGNMPLAESASANAGDKISIFYNNCTQSCKKSGKCDSGMSGSDLQNCLNYCNNLQGMFKMNAAVLDNPMMQNSLKGFECLANAGSCDAMKECHKYFEDLQTMSGSMSQSMKGIPGISQGINPDAAQQQGKQ